MHTEFCGLLSTISWEMNPLGSLTISICGQIDAELLSFGQTVQDRLQDGLDSRDDRSSRCRISKLGNNTLSFAGCDVHCYSAHGYLHVINRQMMRPQSRTLEQSVNWSRAMQLKGFEGECELPERIRAGGYTSVVKKVRPQRFRTHKVITMHTERLR